MKETLRDKFALRALPTILAEALEQQSKGRVARPLEYAAQRCYQLADICLAVRGPDPKPKKELPR